MEDASIGPYHVVSRLGAGGMGEVYLALDTRLNRKVALKYLSDPFLDLPRARDRVLREARAAAQISHPNIAAIYDVLDTATHPCIVMEYAQGETLAHMAGHGPMPCAQVLSIGSQLADALAHAHGAGVVHRDLKPANIVLTPNGTVKVLDFGLARAHDVEHELVEADAPTREVIQSLPGTVAGTPAYMAPEQLAGRPASPLSDIYSLGVTLYELLTGRRPFDGETTAEIVFQVLSQPTPLASATNGSVLPLVDAIVAKAMSRQSAERYQSAAEMADDIRKAERALGGASDHGSVSGTSAALAATLGLATFRRRRLVTIGMVLVAGALATAFGYAWWERRPLNPPDTAVSVAVFPFTAATNEPAAVLAGVGFSESLADALEGLSSIAVLSRPDFISHLAAAPDRLKGAGEVGVSMVVSGEVKPRGATLQFAIRVQQPEGKVVFSRSYEGSESEFSGLQKRAATDVVSALNISLTAGDRERLRRVPACRADAYGDIATGRALLDREDVPGNPAKAEHAFSQAVRKDSRCAPGFLGLADARLAQYRSSTDPALVEPARQAIDAAAALDPYSPSINRSYATLYLSTGKLDQAEKSVRLVIDRRPLDDEPHRMLSTILSRQGRTEEARAELQRAIDMRPNNVINHIAQGNTFYREGRYADAARAYSRVLDIQPDNVWAVSNLGAAYWMNGERQKAVAVLEGVRNPDATILSNLSAFYIWDGRYQEAVPILRKAIDMDPRSDRKHLNLGDTYMRLGLRDDALEQYRQAADLAREQLKIDDKDGATLSRHALYDAKLGRSAEALQHAARAVELNPDDTDVLFKRAQVHALLGQRDPAVRWLRQAIEKGFSRSRAADDMDLESIRKLPEVVEMLRESR